MQTDAAPGTMARATAGIEAVEIKQTVAATGHARALAVLGLRPQGALWRRLFFYDTPGLELHAGGVVLRARATVGEPDDSTVKIRPVDPARVERWRGTPGFKLEADIVGAAVIRSASLTSRQGRTEIEAVARGERAVAKLFSQAQEAFLGALAPSPVALAELLSLGPVHVRRWQVRHPGLPQRICAEAWRMPDGGSLLELSIKADPAAAASAAAGFSGFLAELGIAVREAPEPKTRTALTSLVAASQR
ncbi:hypothetical protein [Nannocystis bainbridge]|uniref:CYTH domain-containing protein n=1 Tax=Nannocystis bainbridge TaxID=2995303 RepID=A0ABT5ECR2_9BACT|nr:hypothetical protein [Nannocystis bainbridge]MDC0723114.1 hypothetical protein [Nannocystis bainbridge]